MIELRDLQAEYLQWLECFSIWPSSKLRGVIESAYEVPESMQDISSVAASSNYGPKLELYVFAKMDAATEILRLRGHQPWLRLWPTPSPTRPTRT